MKRLPYLLWPLALALQIVGFSDLRHDDAFITLRYGQNLALGHGLVFNPGERLMGSTSPGEALLSAAVYAFVGLEATPSVMSALGCAGWTAQSIAIYLLLARALGRPFAVAVSACVLAGAAGSYRWVALETNLAVALALFALVAARRGRWVLVALFCGLAAIVRGDTLLLAALLGLRLLLEARRAGWGVIAKPALAAVAVLSPWLVFAQSYYGEVLPRSLRAKLQRTSFEDYGAHMLQVVARDVLGDGGALAQMSCIALVVLGAVLVTRKSRELGWFVAYGGLHFAAYSVLRTVVGHDWHFYPGVLVAVVLAISGVLLVIASLVHRATAAARFEREVVIGMGLVLAAAYGARAQTAAAEHPEAYWNGSRDAAYRQLGAFMRPRTEPGQRFASVEVGTLAYYTQLPAFDIGMLVSDRNRRPEGHIRWVVLDPTFLGLAPPWPPLGRARAKGGFRAHLYEVPEGQSYFDILHERLAAARRAGAAPR